MLFPPWVIFHIPHDSIAIPDNLRNQFVLTDAQLQQELMKMTDLHTFELFADGLPEHQIVRFPISRLVVDVERFEDDSDEPMAPRGMGVIYKSTHELKPLRIDLKIDERSDLINSWYHPHHLALSNAVDYALKLFNRALIVDAHSFPSIPLPYENNSYALRPEICIGTDDFHTPIDLISTMAKQLRLLGLEVAINTPFSGAIVPSKHYQQDGRVASVMIEVRRDLYLNEENGTLKDDWELVSKKIRKGLLTWLV